LEGPASNTGSETTSSHHRHHRHTELTQADLTAANGRPHKWGQLTPLEKWIKKLKSENMQKEQFSMFMLYFESNQGRQA